MYRHSAKESEGFSKRKFPWQVNDRLLFAGREFMRVIYE